MNKALKITSGIVLGTYVVSVLALTFADKLIIKKYNLSSPYTMGDNVITYDSTNSRFAWDLGIGLTLNNLKISPKASPNTTAISAQQIAVSVKLLPILWGNSSLVVHAQDLNLGAGKSDKGSKRLFSDEPITVLSKLAILDHITLSSNGGKLNGIAFDNFKLNADLHATQATANIDVDFAGGPIHTRLDYDAQNTPNLKVKVQGKNVQTSQMKESFVIKGGAAKIDIETTHTGKTSAALAASTEGHAIIRVGSGELKRNWMNLMNLSLDEGVLGIFDTLTKVGKNAQLECASVTLDFKNGLGNLAPANGIATDTSTLLASGTVNLKNESLSLRLKPQPANGSPSTSLIKIEGTLSAPRLAIAPMEVGKAGVKLLTGIVSGGMSLLAKDAMNAVESKTEQAPAEPKVNLCEISK